ncbi:hypothetical protein EVAR_38128_1 [Eumeta japonica]|uniref:Uncharacterized protein n=1 Tax=Eumeta variegata TaxID=151549 RepID=A0A4C1YQ87_EUMVA|nr:hypothetical protein EVAR_38128_1 [Eumeta japonica]
MPLTHFLRTSDCNPVTFGCFIERLAAGTVGAGEELRKRRRYLSINKPPSALRQRINLWSRAKCSPTRVMCAAELAAAPRLWRLAPVQLLVHFVGVD